MGYSGLFKASELGTEWEGYHLLAEVCEAAGLTRRQAHCVLLFGRGWSWAQMSPVLHVSRANVRKYFLVAVRKMGRSRPHLHQERREWARMVLWCFRNVRRAGDPAVPVYDLRGMPVTTRSRVVTEEDLIGEETDFLAWLVEDLKGSAGEEGQEVEIEPARVAA